MLNLSFLAVINHLYYYYRISGCYFKRRIQSSTCCLTRCPLTIKALLYYTLELSTTD